MPLRSDVDFMRLALDLAQRAALAEEVPVGAVRCARSSASRMKSTSLGRGKGISLEI